MGGDVGRARERAVMVNMCGGHCLISALYKSPYFAFGPPWEVGPSAVAPCA